MPVHFRAPWSRTLTLITLGVVALLVALWFAGVVPRIISLAVLGVSLAFTVRGYIVDGDTLRILRLGWETRIDLRDLVEADVAPNAMRGSIRTFGIGGLFGFVGRFRSATLGPYRSYATDTARSVVLDLGETTVVVTPDRPDDFVAALPTAG